MRTRSILRSPRGSALMELMVSSVILLVVFAGFLGAARESINASAVAQRRTVAMMLRTALMERFTVGNRDLLATRAGAGWIVEGCYDINGLPLAENPALNAGFSCPGTTAYSRNVSVTATAVGGVAQRIWSVAVYVTRTVNPCTSDTRTQSLSCVAADMYLTD